MIKLLYLIVLFIGLILMLSEGDIIVYNIVGLAVFYAAGHKLKIFDYGK